MTAIHKRRTTCRLCNSPDVELAFALEPAPLSELYLPPERAHEADQRYPLDVFLCRACGGVQLLDVIDASHLFRNYTYTSSMSPDLGEHFKKYAAAVCDRFKPKPGSLVVDVGSNDGTLLRQFKALGYRVQGVEPAFKIAEAAILSGVPTMSGFMNALTAAHIVGRNGRASLVCANNVLAHAEEPGIILDGVRECLADDGAFVFEVAYLPDQLRNLVCDNFYHEHGCFYTAGAFNSLLHRHGMEMFDAELVPTKGGSLRGFAHKLGKSFPAERLATMTKVSGLIRSEKEFQDPHTYCKFLRRVNERRDQTVACLREYQSKNLKVAGYGASSTTTLLLHHFKAGEFLSYLVDDNRARWGTLSPGYHLPVRSPEALYGPDRPDAVLVTAWRFADAILARHKAYLDGGGVFVVPLPTFREVTR